VGTAPTTDGVVVVIFNSLNWMFLLLSVQNDQLNGRLNGHIIGFSPMRLNFIFMMSIIHNADTSPVLA
jgi:hypothetical protein